MFLFKLRVLLTSLKTVLVFLDLQMQGANADIQEQPRVGVCSYRGKSDYIDAPQDIIIRNVQHYKETIALAKLQNVKLVLFPEGGLTTLAPFQGKLQVHLKYSLDMTDWKSSCPCDDELWIRKNRKGQAIRDLSCAAKSHEIYVVVNILEKETSNNNTNIFNTNLVFTDTGHIIIRYRKIIPNISTGNITEDNNNTFTFKIGASTKTYKTIIGNDIYDNFTSNYNSEDILLWSTASNKNSCDELPAETVVQVFQKQNRSILISDYQDESSNSASCIYDNEEDKFYFGHETEDELIIMTKETKEMQRTEEFKSTRKKIFANCFIKEKIGKLSTKKQLTVSENEKRGKERDWENSTELKYKNCTIKYSMLKSGTYCPFYIDDIATKDHHPEFNMTLCGVISGNCTCEDSLGKSIYSETRLSRIQVSVNVDTSCKLQQDILVPITGDINYLPLDQDRYTLENTNISYDISIENTSISIFAFMVIRNINNRLCENESRNNIGDNTKLGTVETTFISSVVVVIVVVILFVGVMFIVHYKKKSKTENVSLPLTVIDEDKEERKKLT